MSLGITLKKSGDIFVTPYTILPPVQKNLILNPYTKIAFLLPPKKIASILIYFYKKKCNFLYPYTSSRESNIFIWYDYLETVNVHQNPIWNGRGILVSLHTEKHINTNRDTNTDNNTHAYTLNISGFFYLKWIPTKYIFGKYRTHKNVISKPLSLLWPAY